jgi:Fuc2NAc and GlcNAc transferase
MIFIPFLFLLSIIGSIGYKKIAISNKVLATPNHRTLHEIAIPKGGGIVFSTLTVFSVVLVWWKIQLADDLLWVLVTGGLAASIFGFLDDLKNIRASIKLIMHILLSAWTVYWLDGCEQFLIDWVPRYLSLPLIFFFLVWMINGYNFIDGIDGMAASGAIFISLTIALVMFLTVGYTETIYVFIFLATAVSGFLIFNWPKASIFMGDSGSVFLGYNFGVLLIFTVMNGDVSIWTWLVVLGYFLSDVVVTQILRVILVKKWWHAHRSHAYQNLARITGNHLKVTRGVAVYNLFWILPLTIWSALVPEFALIAVFLAIVPATVVVFRYGPIYSSS